MRDIRKDHRYDKAKMVNVVIYEVISQEQKEL